MMMRSYSVTYALSGKLDLAIEWILYALLAFMPLAFGVVHAWSEEVVIVTAAILMLLCGLRFKLAGGRMTGFWALAAVGVFLAVPVIQLYPFHRKGLIPQHRQRQIRALRPNRRRRF
jgi:hypothetical protein